VRIAKVADSFQAMERQATSKSFEVTAVTATAFAANRAELVGRASIASVFDRCAATARVPVVFLLTPPDGALAPRGGGGFADPPKLSAPAPSPDAARPAVLCKATAPLDLTPGDLVVPVAAAGDATVTRIAMRLRPRPEADGVAVLTDVGRCLLSLGPGVGIAEAISLVNEALGSGPGTPVFSASSAPSTRVRAVATFPRATGIEQLRAFLGSADTNAAQTFFEVDSGTVDSADETPPRSLPLLFSLGGGPADSCRVVLPQNDADAMVVKVTPSFRRPRRARRVPRAPPASERSKKNARLPSSTQRCRIP
jgi:hypothetical protein